VGKDQWHDSDQAGSRATAQKEDESRGESQAGSDRPGKVEESKSGWQEGAVESSYSVAPRKGKKMPDIKLIIVYADTIEEEDEWMKRNAGQLLYPLNQKPKFPDRIHWVYFVHNNVLDGRAKPKNFIEDPGRKVINAKGRELTHRGWFVECGDMVVLEPPKRNWTPGGFQGFRYVQESERTAFEQAFQ